MNEISHVSQHLNPSHVVSRVHMASCLVSSACDSFLSAKVP